MLSASRICRFLCVVLAVLAAVGSARLQAAGIEVDSTIPVTGGTKVWANRSVVVDSTLPMARADELPSFFPLSQVGPIQPGDGFFQELLPAMFTDAGDPGFYATEPGLPEAAIINDASVIPSPSFGDRLWNDFSDGFVEWTSRISLGARSLSGNSKQNFIDFAADFEKKEETRATQINLQGQFGESDDKVVANRWFANSTTDFYRGDHWLVFAKLMDQYDQLQNLDYRGTFSAGLGYRFFFEENRRLIVRLGPGVTTEFFHSPSDNRTTPDIFSEVELRLPIWERLKWEQKTTVFPSLSELAVARAQSQTAFLYAFDEKERWSLKVGFQYQYISEPNPGRLPNDFTTNLSIVYLRK